MPVTVGDGDLTKRKLCLTHMKFCKKYCQIILLSSKTVTDNLNPDSVFSSRTLVAKALKVVIMKDVMVFQKNSNFLHMYSKL